MKKRLNFIALIITTTPFAFTKMEGPFIVDVDYISDLSISIDIKEKILKFMHECLYIPYIFIYDKKTGYTIGYVPKTKIPNINVIKFFQGEHNALDNYKQYSPRFYFAKEKPNLELKHFEELTTSKQIPSYVKSEPNPSKTQIPSFVLQSSVYTLSGVEIINGNPTLIKYNDKSQNFNKSFKNYFKKTNNTKFAEKLYNKNNVDIMTLLKGHHFNPTKSELNLLKHSKILAGYGVLKGPADKESIIWGLAKDKKTNKNYHWITDLENDSSALID